MQFDDPESTQNPTLATKEPETPASKSLPPLRREAMVRASERNHGALIAVCCSFAGVGVGFGLSQVASMQAPTSQHVIIHETRSVAPAPTPETAVTWLGVKVQSSVHARRGAHIVKVIPGSPAEKAGLAVGDIVVGLGNARVHSSQDLVRAVRAQPIGRRLVISTVNDQGQDSTRPVVLAGISARTLHCFKH